MKKRDIILFVSIFMVLSLVAGGTYAYWGWASDVNKTVVFNTSKSVQEYINYDEGDSHFVGDFQPTASFCDAMSTTISVNLNTTNMNAEERTQINKGILEMSINMDINHITSDIANSQYVYWIVTSGDTSSCPGSLSSALAYGTFSGKSSGNTFTLLANNSSKVTTITEAEKKFTVWIWINSAGGSGLSSLSGDTIDVNIWSQIDMLDVSEDAE